MQRVRRTVFTAVIMVATVAVGLRSSSISDQTSATPVAGDSFAEEATYLVWTLGSRVYVEEFKTGFVEFEGSDPAAAIQWALDNLPSYGGKVVLKNGIYRTRAEIRVPSNAVLEGEGVDSTLIERDTSVGFVNLIRNADRRRGNSNIRISNLTVDAGFPYSGVKAGGILGGSVDLALVRNVVIRNVRSINARSYNFEVCRSQDVHFIDCIAERSGNDCFSVTDNANPAGLSGASESRRIHFLRCKAIDAAESGFEVDDGPQFVYYIECESSKQFSIHAHENQTVPSHIYYTSCRSPLFLIKHRDDGTGVVEDVLIKDCCVGPGDGSRIVLKGVKNVSIENGAGASRSA